MRHYPWMNSTELGACSEGGYLITSFFYTGLLDNILAIALPPTTGSLHHRH